MTKITVPGLVFMLLLLALTTYAEISVKSFRLLENDLDARVNYPMKDQNGDVCAIIKVVTSQTGFSFDGGMTGIVKTIEKPSEIWVYVPWGLKRLSIFHPQLGQLRDYMLTMSVERACVYELQLISGRIETTVVEEIVSQWLVINPKPANALVYINDEFVRTGDYSAKLKPGTYNYRVELPLYHTEAGVVELGIEKKTLSVSLKPAFGYIKVNSLPESGAQVFVDDKLLPSSTPLTTEPIASGEHTVQVVKEMYQPVAQKVTVADGQTIPLNVKMQPNFAELTINAPVGANILINNQQKGTGSWNGRLSAGVYSVEASLAQHRSARQDLELATGDKQSIDLQPTPIYGSLDVVSSPMGATIIIDGKEYGTTPNTIERILIGDYTVKLNKAGYELLSQKITIKENTNQSVNVSLLSQKSQNTSQIDESLGLVSDIDGNLYHTVKIGSQTWMVENLKVSRYRNGDKIPNVTDNTAWSKLNSGAWCNYDNDSTNERKFGKLYNWNAIFDKREIAPTGWRVPTAYEWDVLSENLGGDVNAAAKIREVGMKDWIKSRYHANTPIVGTNTSGFTALPAGQRTGDGTFFGFREYCAWWSSTIDNATDNYVKAFSRSIDNSKTNFIENTERFQSGLSIRCIKDEVTQTLTETVNGISFEMVIVKGGSFNMGSISGEKDEIPSHNVTLSNYAIGQTEVTQALWKAVMGKNPSKIKGDNFPVEKVSWVNCQSFITKLNQLTGKSYRMPTEAEWEYAARGGVKRNWYNYAGCYSLDNVGWYADNSGGALHDVGTKKPNELGVFDMSGNVTEWCSDWYGPYGNNAQTNPIGASNSASERMLSAPSGDVSYMDRVMRGGSYHSEASSCRVKKRFHTIPSALSAPESGIGFRLALSY